MDHLKIIKESFRLVIKHRYLWLLGILLGTGSSMNWLNYSSNNPNMYKPKDAGTNIASLVSANVKDAGEVLGEKISSNISNTEWVIAAALVLLLICLAVYLTITARGAITWAIVKLQSGAKFKLKDAWGLGHKYFWRRLSYAIITGALIIVVMAILAIPVILLAIFELTIPAIIFGILFGLAFVIFLIYLSLFLPYSERILFLENKKTIEALKSGYKLFNKNWLNLILMYLILLAIGIACAMALAFVILICGLIAFGIGAAFYYANHILGYTVGGVLGLAVVIALIIVGGALSAFNWTAITLAYKEAK